jgi:hypothetical protein
MDTPYISSIFQKEFQPQMDIICCSDQNSRTKLHGFSPQANYNDRATSACRQS